MTTSAGESFVETEARIAAVKRRTADCPDQLVTLMRLTVHLQKRLQDRYNAALKAHGLNLTTYNALMMIYGSEDERLRVSQLAIATGEKATNITRICDELVNKRLIRRTPDTRDRRVVVLSLSARGRRLIETALPEVWSLLEQVYAPFSASQRDQLERLLRAQLAGMESSTA